MGWDQFDDDEAEYRKRLAALTPAASSILTFKKEAAPGAGALGPKLVEGVKNCAGLGGNDSPAGRQAAYKQVIFPLGDAAEQGKAMGGCPNASSCGTFIRGIWQLYGIGAPKNGSPNRGFRAAYEDDTVIGQIGLFGFDCGALHGTINTKIHGVPFSKSSTALDPKKDIEAWRPGDVIYVVNTKIEKPDDPIQHIFTVVSPATVKHKIAAIKIFELLTVDGGQFGAGSDGGCRAIKATSKLFRTDGFKITIYEMKPQDKWQVSWWVEAASLVTNEPDILIPQIQQAMPGAKFPP